MRRTVNGMYLTNIRRRVALLCAAIIFSTVAVVASSPIQAEALFGLPDPTGFQPDSISFFPQSLGLGTPNAPITDPMLGYGYWYLEMAYFSSAWFHGPVGMCATPPQLLFELSCTWRAPVIHVNSFGANKRFTFCLGHGPCPNSTAYHSHYQVWRSGFVVWMPLTRQNDQQDKVCAPSCPQNTVPSSTNPDGGTKVPTTNVELKFPASKVDSAVLSANAFQNAQQVIGQTIRFNPITSLTCDGGKIAPCDTPPTVASSSPRVGLGAGPYLTSVTISSFSLTPPTGHVSPTQYEVVTQPTGKSLATYQDAVLKFHQATTGATKYQYSAQATIVYQIRPWTLAAGSTVPVWGTPVSKTMTVTLSAPNCHPTGCAFGVLGAAST